MASIPPNPTQLTPPRVAFIDDRSGAISREWYRFFLSLLTATQTNQQEASLAPDTNSLLASYDAVFSTAIQDLEEAPDCCSATASLASEVYSLTNAVFVTPPDLGGTVTSVAASGGSTGLTFTGSPITTSGTLTLGGLLGIANGGTNSTATPTAGGIAYGTGTAYAFSAAGTAGQFLTSTGAGTPTWSTGASSFGTAAYWGSFWDTTDQVAPAANTAYSVTLNSYDTANNGVTVVSGSRVTFAHAGVYSLTFSIQFVNTSTQIHDVNVWLRKNDSGSTGDIPDSDTRLSIQQKHGGVDGYGLMTVNFVLSVVAGDYIEMIWATTDTAVSIQSVPAGTAPVSPSIPGVIFTAVSAPQIGLGYAGVTSTTSMTIGTGSKTFTTNVSSADTAFIVGNRVRLIYNTTNYMEGTITAFSGTSMTVSVDTTAGSGTYTAWSIGLTGVVNTGVTSFSGGSTGLTPATATSGAVTLAGTLGVGYGGTGQTSYTNGQLLIGNSTGNTLTKATLTAGTNVSITNGAGSITINATDQYVGTVTTVSVVSANGFAGTVANATTTPAITLTTTITGVLKGDGTAISAATKDVDYLAPSTPVTKTADFTVGVGENWFINNKSGSTCTVTLPAASSYAGRAITFQNYQDQLLVSASSNVVPRAGGAAGTAILDAVAGNWATLVSNGTNWVIMQAAPFNCMLI